MTRNRFRQESLVWGGVIILLLAVTLFLPADVVLTQGVWLGPAAGDQVGLSGADGEVTLFQGLSILAILIAVAVGGGIGQRLLAGPRWLPWPAVAGGILAGLPPVLWTTYRVRLAGYAVSYEFMTVGLVLLAAVIAYCQPADGDTAS